MSSLAWFIRSRFSLNPRKSRSCRLRFASCTGPARFRDENVNVPHPSAILRLLGFAVAAGLAMAGIQPLVAATTGAIDVHWAVGLTVPALITAGVLWMSAIAMVRSHSH